MKNRIVRYAHAVCMAAAVVVAAAGCGRSDATGEAFSVGDLFEDGASGNKPAGVTRRPADGGGDDVTLFWYWVSGCVSEEGAAEDLRAFAREGFKRVVISEIELPELHGPVRHDVMDDGWWEALRAALRTAAEEHVELGITARPGLGSFWPYTAGAGAWNDADVQDEDGRAAAERHFNAYAGRILARVPAAERSALRFVVAGNVPPASADISVLGVAGGASWRAGYIGRMAELCHAAGLDLVSRDVDAALLCGTDGGADLLLASARFVPDGVTDDCRTAASAARLCGMRRVAAEVGNTEPLAYATVPAALKRAADMAYVQGVNDVALTGAVQQATLTDFPGLNTWLFSDMDRNNPWFEHVDMLVDYLWRCNMMLVRGDRVTDVAVPFAGENMARTADLVAEAGYDADYLPLAALAAAEVRDGAVVAAGRPYAAVVCERALPEEAERVLERLSARGARVVRADMSRSDRMAMKEALAGAAAPDVTLEAAAQTDYSPLRYTHRREKGRDIYFLFNGSTEPLRGRLSLRCGGGAPEVWNPVEGSRHAVAEFSGGEGRTSFEIGMAAGESLFVVVGGGSAARAASRRLGGYPFEYRWDVEFSSPVSEPFATKMYDLKDLSQNGERRIRFFSGRATYRSLFEVRKPAGCDRVDLVMRDVGTSAKVWINDRYVGGVWTAPYRLDVTDAVRNGVNSIRIETANTWVNAIVGLMTSMRGPQAAAPESEKTAAERAAGEKMPDGNAAENGPDNRTENGTEADSLTDKGWRAPQLHFVVNTYTERSELPVSGLAAGVSLIYYGK